MSPPDPEASLALRELDAVKTRVDGVLDRFFANERSSIEEDHPAFLSLLQEIERLVRAGGKRIRPAFCYWGYRAAGGEESDAIWKVAAALELFHTFALIHDDVMDRSDERRGTQTIHAKMGAERDEQFGVSSAILAGDLAHVLSDVLFLHSGFESAALLHAFRGHNRRRVEVAVGQFLDLSVPGRDVNEWDARQISFLKSGSYTVMGPLQVGADLAPSSARGNLALNHYGVPLGQAFQIRNDLEGALGGGADLAQAKPTVLLATARRLASDEDRGFLDERLGRGELTEEERGRAVAILRSSGAVQATVDLIDELVAKAVKALREEGAEVLDPEALQTLHGMAKLLTLPPSWTPSRLPGGSGRV